MSSTYGTDHEADRKNASTLVVIGGGLAGIAAAEAACRKGFRVELFEWSGVLGGRAASIYEPVSGRWIDNGQHVTMGCCTEWTALNERLDLAGFFEKKDAIPFARCDGKRWMLAASPYLPNHWQLVPAFLKIPFLSFRDRLATGLLVRKLAKRNRVAPDRRAASPAEQGSFADWLAEQRVSEKAIEKFWAPLVLSSLCETVDNVSFDAVLKVVLDGFCSGKDAMTLFVPTAPLRAIYHDAAAGRLRQRGVELHFHSRVRRLHWEFGGEEPEAEPSNYPTVTALELADGTVCRFDRYVLAVPSFRAWDIFESSELEAYAEQLGLERFQPAAITSLHLWFERRLLPTGQPHTALLGGPGQFLFCPACPSSGKIGPESDFEGVYHTVVISASHRLLSDNELTSRGSGPLIERVVEQLRDTFPEAFRDGNALRHFRVTTFFDAVFSPRPELYRDRPLQETPFTNMALAGDWTQTEWPSTLEGAVRSGLGAVEALTGDES